MLTLGPLAFAAPWLLLALGVLPILWWLLRLTPPAPQRIRFPAIRLLFDLVPREETPHRTPLWLIIFRLLLAALIIAALAHPLVNPARQLAGSGPLLLVIDDGWGAAARWATHLETATDLIDRAEREGRQVILLTTAPRPDGQPIAASGVLTAAQARERLQALAPQPWPTDRAAAGAAVERLVADVRELGPPNIVWLSDGVAAREDEAAGFAQRLQRLGSLTVLSEANDGLPLLLRPPPNDPAGMELRLQRPAAGAARTVAVRGVGADGRLVTRQEVRFSAGAREATARASLPAELHNRIARLAVEGEESAGATVLFDEGWRRRPVGIVGGVRQREEQPLLGELYYLERALAPYNEVRRGDIASLLQGKQAVIVLADIGTLSAAEINQLAGWIERGGVLLRFAGQWLAQKPDELLPVRLRGTDRAMGGAMSWAQPLRLAPFPATSPFTGLKVPNDVTIRRQVLAEPEIDLGDKTWARLTDGTPLVTAARRGQGWIVLVHTTANADWSSLAISGLFVEMLQRIVALSEGILESEGGEPLPPLESLDGFGRLTTPPPIATAVTPQVIDAGTIDPRHPPGYYGRGSVRRALNLASGVRQFLPLGDLPSGVVEATYAKSPEIDLKPWLLALALPLIILDMLIALLLRGLLTFRRTVRVAGFLLLFLSSAGVAWAQDRPSSDDPDAFAIAATSQTHLAYVRTGTPEIDATSRAGLQGLSNVLNDRTAVEVGTPFAVDVEKDELAFFPLLYWPISPEQPVLSDAALAHLNTFLRNGGTILFDTRDQDAGRALGASSSGPGMQRLQQLARGLDIPRLVPVPPDHVLTRAFYLMQDFPGRWADGQVWVEQGDDRVNDGVSSVIIGGNDWASAWAVDDNGRPMFAVVPGGERQREMAYRFGINLVMYALTGNYKSDQVHVPFILERLGQ
jgi:Domain of unknown function (DUF4159)/Aerotolerance regulator N-terminal